MILTRTLHLLSLVVSSAFVGIPSIPQDVQSTRKHEKEMPKKKSQNLPFPLGSNGVFEFHFAS
jgi:hypothetical protein